MIAIIALLCAQVDTATTPKSGARWMVVPNVAYDTDDGLGFGVRGELAIDEPGHDPYHTGWVVHAFASLRGYHHHRLRFDRVGFGPENRLRLTLHLAWRQWLNDGYWGLGNMTLREKAYSVELPEDDPGRKRYRYSLFQPFAHLTLRARATGNWLLYGALTGKYSIIETYPGSLLEEQRPFGIDGGLTILLQGGVLYDSRRPEGSPSSGIVFELGGRVAPPLPSGAGTFGGFTASFRSFLSPASWVVIASRVMGDVLLGEIPFYEMVHFGGLFPVMGFGGFETIRGLSFGRFRAPGKALANLEARIELFEHPAFGDTLRWQLVPYGDVGMVFIDDPTPTLGRFPLHPGFGAGIRAIYQQDFVGRIDTGFGLDPVQSPDGSIKDELNFGMYVVFDQAF